MPDLMVEKKGVMSIILRRRFVVIPTRLPVLRCLLELDSKLRLVCVEKKDDHHCFGGPKRICFVFGNTNSRFRTDLRYRKTAWDIRTPDFEFRHERGPRNKPFAGDFEVGR